MCIQFCDIDAWEKLAQIIEREKNVPSTYYQDVNMKCSNNAHTLHEKNRFQKQQNIGPLLLFPITGFVLKNFQSKMCLTDPGIKIVPLGTEFDQTMQYICDSLLL